MCVCVCRQKSEQSFGKLMEDAGMIGYDYNVNIHRKMYK